jgi:hypothetical protein
MGPGGAQSSSSRPRPRARGGEHHARGGGVLHRQADRLAERELLRRGASGPRAAHQLTDLHDVVRRDQPALQGFADVGRAGRVGLPGGVPVLQDHQRPAHRGDVHLAPGRRGPHGGDVDARAQPRPPHHRLGRAGGRADHVRTGRRLLLRPGRPRRQPGRSELVGQPGRLARVPPGEAHLGEGAHRRRGERMGPRLDPVPRTASTRASSRTSSRIESADPAAVRAAVIASPSITATGVPVAGSKTTISAWWEGTSVFRGKTDTSLAASTRLQGCSRAWHRGCRRPRPRGPHPRGHRGVPGAEVGHGCRQRLDKGQRVQQRLDLATAQVQHRPILLVRRTAGQPGTMGWRTGTSSLPGQPPHERSAGGEASRP